MWFILTVVLYIIAKWISNKANTPFLNPLLVSVAAIIGVLILFNIPFEHYYAQNEFVTFLLQPAVVALAYPLYEQLPQIRQNWKVILLTCTIGSSMSMFSATLLAAYFQANPTLLASVVAKSVTTPIAMVISSHLGGEPAITAILVLIVGLFGSIIATQSTQYSILHIQLLAV